MITQFATRFRAIVEPLYDRSLTAADGVSAEDLEDAQRRCGYELPEALQAFYLV